MATDYKKVREHVAKTARRMFATFDKRREALLDTCYEFYPLGVPGLKLGVEELADGFEFDDDHRMLTLMPLQMLRKSASGFNSNLTSPARSWFELQLPDNMANGSASHDQLKALDALKQAAEKTLSGSNAYTQIYKLYEHLLCVGFGCMLISEDDAQVIHCQTLRIGTYALDIDEKGRVCRVARRFAWTPQHILEEFGEDWTPDDIKEQCKKGSSRRVEVWNLIEPNPQGFARNFDPLEKDGADVIDESFAFRSFYMLRGGGGSRSERSPRHGVLRLTGYAHNPIIAPRLDYESGDIYGVGRCMELVYNARGAQTFKGDELRISGMRAQPPVVAGSDFKDGIKLGRGGVNITESGDQRTGMVTSIFTNLPDAQDTRQCLEESKNEIMDALYVDAFAVIDSQKNNPGVKTATEVEYLKTENLAKLGSIAINLNLEMLDPLVRTVTEYAFDARVQPLTEDDLEILLDGSQRDKDGAIVSTEGAVINAVKIEYVSQIALAQKAGALTSVQSYIAFCGNLAAINPTAPDNPVENIDRDKTARMFSRMLGVPEEVNRDPKQVAAQRKAAADAIAQQQQMQQLAQTVDAAEKIGSIPVDDAHAGGIVKGLM